MKRSAAFRISADLCFFFSVLSVFPAFTPWMLPMALFVAAALVVSLIAVHCPYAALRCLLALLPGLCFLGAPLSPLLVFPALGWLYLILSLTLGRFHAWLDDYRSIYRVQLVVCLCFLAANIAHNTVYRGAVISWPSLVYALAFLCLGVLAMRGMQMNAKMSAGWQLANAATVVGVPVLAVGGSLLIYLLLRALAPAVRYLFRPIGLFVLWLFDLFTPDYAEPVPTPTPEPLVLPTPAFVEEATGHGNMMMDDMADNFKMASALLEKAAAIGGYVVLGLLLLLAIWFIVRYVRRGALKPQQEDYLYEETEEGGKPRRRGAKAETVRGGARQIRRIYQQYMELMRANGVAIQRDSTSGEILDEAERINLSAAARRLRELYLKARYGDDSSVTPEDVQEAQRCFEEIKKEFTA